MAGLISLAILLALYFTPSIIAHNRNHRQFTAIFLLNLITGWTFIGWVAALIWSVIED
jgi:hypothetical protein